jgi:flagellar protein FliJ
MANSSRLSSVLRVAQSLEQEAARVVGSWQTRVQEKSARLTELRRYYAEYAAGSRDLRGQTICAADVRDRGAFVSKLHDAIQRESDAWKRLQSELKIYISRWESARAHAQAMRKLVARDTQRLQQRAARREQAATDEFLSTKSRSAV